MRVRFIRGTALGGIGNDAAPGDERDLPDDQATRLVSAGRAVLAIETAVSIVSPAGDKKGKKKWTSSAIPR